MPLFGTVHDYMFSYGYVCCSTSLYGLVWSSILWFGPALSHKLGFCVVLYSVVQFSMVGHIYRYTYRRIRVYLQIHLGNSFWQTHLSKTHLISQVSA